MKGKHIILMITILSVAMSLVSVALADYGAYEHYGDYLVTTWIPELGTFAYYDMEYDVYLKWSRSADDYPTNILGAGIEFSLLGIENFDPVQFAYYTDGIAHRLDQVGVITVDTVIPPQALAPETINYSKSYTNGYSLNDYITYPNSVSAAAAGNSDSVLAEFSIFATAYIVPMGDPFRPQMLVNLVK